jgi:hypothetical protein
MKEMSIERMEAIYGGGCNDRNDAIAANTMCGFFFIASFVPALWGIGIVGSAACVAMGIGCAVLMG